MCYFLKFVVCFNGYLPEPFSPSRRLRQEDPLSIYLFSFVVKVLCMLLNDACAGGGSSGFHLNRKAPGISHLLFADDSLLFFKGSINQALTIKNILTVYEKGIGHY